MKATISEGRVSARPSRPAVGGGEKAELTLAQSLFPHPKGQRQQAARHGLPAPSGPGGPHPNRRQFLLRSHPPRMVQPIQLRMVPLPSRTLLQVLPFKGPCGQCFPPSWRLQPECQYVAKSQKSP